MIKIILALGLMTAAAPTLATAQPYDRDEGRYCDDQGRCSDRPAPNARDESSDSSYRGQSTGRDDRGDSDQYTGRNDRGDVGQYTGRVGSHWIDADGRRCAWREKSVRDDDGDQAFKWVTVCRE